MNECVIMNHKSFDNNNSLHERDKRELLINNNINSNRNGNDNGENDSKLVNSPSSAHTVSGSTTAINISLTSDDSIISTESSCVQSFSSSQSPQSSSLSPVKPSSCTVTSSLSAAFDTSVTCSENLTPTTTEYNNNNNTNSTQSVAVNNQNGSNPQLTKTSSKPFQNNDHISYKRQANNPSKSSINRFDCDDSNNEVRSKAFKRSDCANQTCEPAKHLVHWFRKGLRLHDQPALIKGLQGCETFRCIYLIDPWFSTQSNCGINKWRFLLQSLEDLDNNLHKLGSRLFVIRGQPAEVFPPLFKEWLITHLSFEEDPEPFGKIRDAKIAKMCKEMNIEVICETSHTLYKLDDIINHCNGEIPLTYLQFQNIISELGKPEEPSQTVTHDIIGNAYTPVSGDHVKKYAVPTLSELGFTGQSNHRSVWIGGETEALQRLARHLEHKAWVATFGKPKLTSLSLLCATQTSLGPYLRFGCISPRLLYHQISSLYNKLKKGSPPPNLYGQLLWREFFYCVATNNPNFDKMQNNPLCVQIAWNSNSEALAKWANGQTGYPWIDAIQTQLRREGWIHQIAKHATVCFLTRGILWISWEEGMKVFDELLIDADWSVNAGTWMWLSCSSFFQRICHIYCPVSFGRKMDPQGDYIRRYLPVLRNIPIEYIHEPWKAPIKVQKEANCKIGKHYPQPIVDHQEAMRINQERMKQVFRILIKGLDLKKDQDVQE